MAFQSRVNTCLSESPSTMHDVSEVRVCHEQYVPQLELVSVTEHNLDQKYTTSWVMDDLHHKMHHFTQVLASHSIPTEYKRHHCCSTVTAALRLDHPPLASGVHSPASPQPGDSLKTNGSRAPPLAQTLAHCFSLSPFTDDSSL